MKVGDDHDEAQETCKDRARSRARKFLLFLGGASVVSYLWENGAVDVLLRGGKRADAASTKTGRQRPTAWTGDTSGLNCSLALGPDPIFDTSLTPTVLASYPGCGSTVTRLLIKLSMSRWTGSVYRDMSLFDNKPHAFRGEKTTENVIAVKTHYPSIAIFGSKISSFRRSVLIVRDPYRAIPSYANYRYGSSHGSPHNGVQAPMAWWEEKRDKGFDREIRSWVDQVKYWVGRHDASDRFTVVYEDLVNPGRALETLRGLASFFGVNSTTEEKLKCAWGEAIRKNETGIKRTTKYVPKFTHSQECTMAGELTMLEKALANETELLRVIRGYRRNVTDCPKFSPVASSPASANTTVPAASSPASANMMMPFNPSSPVSSNIFNAL